MPARPTIVCAIDRSESSRHAVQAARWLAQDLDVSIAVVHAFDEMDIAVPSTRELAMMSLTTDEVVAAARETAEAWLHGISDALAGVEHTVELVEDTPVEGVLRVVRDHDAKLLVTGTAARGPLDRVLVGSVAAELALKAPCPVAPIRAGVLLDRPGPVLAAYDGSDHSLSAARHAAALAARMDRGLVLMHAADDRDDALGSREDLGPELFAAGQQALAGLEDDRGLNLDVEVVTEEGDPIQAITRAAHRLDAALIVAGTRGRGAVTAALLGSVSAGLVRSADRPVVLAR